MRMTRCVIFMCALFCVGNFLQSFKFLLASLVVLPSERSQLQDHQQEFDNNYLLSTFTLVADTLLHCSLPLHLVLNYSFNAKFRNTLRSFFIIDSAVSEEHMYQTRWIFLFAKYILKLLFNDVSYISHVYTLILLSYADLGTRQKFDYNNTNTSTVPVLVLVLFYIVLFRVRSFKKH